jgi:hypothetical protein
MQGCWGLLYAVIALKGGLLLELPALLLLLLKLFC